MFVRSMQSFPVPRATPQQYSFLLPDDTLAAAQPVARPVKQLP